MVVATTFSSSYKAMGGGGGVPKVLYLQKENHQNESDDKHNMCLC